MRPFMKMTNELGYTFLESIFQLLILTVFIHLFLLFFFWKGPIEQRYADHSSTELGIISQLIYNTFFLMSVKSALLNSGKTIRLWNGRGLIDIVLSGTSFENEQMKTGISH